MELSLAQRQALKADIQADAAFAAFVADPTNADLAFAVADAYNLQASPAYYVWKNSVEAREIMEHGFVWTAVDGLTVGKARIWDWLTRYGSFNPSKPNVRQGLSDCFGAASAILASMQPHLKRTSTRAEKLFTFGTGDGTEANPRRMNVEGTLSHQDVLSAMQA